MRRPHPRHTRPAAAVAALALAFAGLTGCSALGGPPECSPPTSVVKPPPGVAAGSASRDGDVAQLDDLTVAFVAAGCTDGPWHAQLEVTYPDGVVEPISLEVGGVAELTDGRAITVLAATPDGTWVDVAVVAAGATP